MLDKHEKYYRRAIKKLSLLSLIMAICLFNIRLAAKASRGIKPIWENLSTAQLCRLNRIKPAFFKNALGLHISSHNHSVHMLVDMLPFVKHLQRQFGLLKTLAGL